MVRGLDNGQEEKPKLELRLIRKQVVVIEVVASQKLLYLNGQNKNGVQSQEKNHQRQEKDIYLKKLLSHYLQENMLVLLRRKDEIKLQENNLVSNLNL